MLPLKGLESLSNFISGKALAKGNAALAGIASRFGAIAAAAAPVATAIGAIGGAFVGVFAIVKVLGVLAGAVSTAVGALTIMGSAFLYAAGSAAALVPVVAALPLALGTAALGFKNVGGAISDFSKYLNETDPEKKAEALDTYRESLEGLQPAARKAVEALEPVIEQFDRVQERVQQKLFRGLDAEIGRLQPTFDIVAQGLKDTASTLNDVFKDISGTLSTGKFKQDLAGVFEGLQPIIADLGSAVGDFVAGLTGLIDALLPSGERLSGNLADMAESFKEFTQSAEGKNKIKDFMDDAFEAADKVFTIIGNIGSGLGTLFGGAKEEGQTFLDKLLIKSEEFEAWIDRVANDGTLDRWLADAEEAMSAVADVLGSIGRAFDALDTPGNRQLFTDILGGVSGFFDWASEVAAFFDSPTWTGLADMAIEPIERILQALALIPEQIPGFGLISTAAQSALDGIDGLRRSWAQPPEGNGLADTLVSSLGGTNEALDGTANKSVVTRGKIEALFGPLPSEGLPTGSLDSALDGTAAKADTTKAAIDAIFQERPVPYWQAGIVSGFDPIVTGARTTDGALQSVVANRPLPSFPSALSTALEGTQTAGKLTDQSLGTVVAPRTPPGWVSTLTGQIETAGGAAVVTKGKIDNIPGTKKTDVTVTDNGTALGVQNAINNIRGRTVDVFIKQAIIPAVGPGVLAPGRSAAGGLFTNPTTRLIGESGPEAVIPLARPLGSVDRSVRDLTALLRGGRQNAVDTGSGKGSGRTVNITMNVTALQADPESVAELRHEPGRGPREVSSVQELHGARRLRGHQRHAHGDLRREHGPGLVLRLRHLRHVAGPGGHTARRAPG